MGSQSVGGRSERLVVLLGERGLVRGRTENMGRLKCLCPMSDSARV